MRNGLNVDYDSKCRAAYPLEEEKQKAIEIFRELKSENQEITYERFTSLWFRKFYNDFFIGRFQVAVLCPGGNISDKKLQAYMSKLFKKCLEQYGTLSMNELNLMLHKDPHISTITNPPAIKEKMDALYLRIICKNDPTKDSIQYSLQRWLKNKTDIIIGTSDDLDEIYLMAENYFKQHYNEKLERRTNQIKNLERKIAKDNTRNNKTVPSPTNKPVRSTPVINDITNVILQNDEFTEEQKRWIIRKLIDKEIKTIVVDGSDEQFLLQAIDEYKKTCDCSRYIYIFCNRIAHMMVAEYGLLDALSCIERIRYGDDRTFRIWVFEKNDATKQVFQSLAILKGKPSARNAIFQYSTFTVNDNSESPECITNNLLYVPVHMSEYITITDSDKARVMCNSIATFNNLHYIILNEQGEKVWLFVKCKQIDKAIKKMEHDTLAFSEN